MNESRFSIRRKLIMQLRNLVIYTHAINTRAYKYDARHTEIKLHFKIL
jgi:hypothetical protein